MRSYSLRWLLLVLLLLISLAIGLLSGSSSMSLNDALAGIEPARTIFFELRLPRVLLAFVAGSSLALAGLLLQALFRNPLAGPFTLGISSGSALGASMILALQLQISPQSGALAGAMLAGLLVAWFGSRSQGRGVEGLLLAGVALNFTFSSLLLLIQVMADAGRSLRIIRWLMGGLDLASWEQLAVPAALLMPVFILLMLFSRHLDLLSLGEETAHARGLDLSKARWSVFLLSSVLVAVLVARTGPIAFVGLMAPHMARMLFGASHKRLIPAALLCGGLLLVSSDALARILLAPSELPVGVVTSMLGGPFFLWILLGKKGR